MKKNNFLISKLSIILLLISSSSIVFSQKKINQNEINYDWGTIYLKGKIKKISLYIYDLTSSDSNTKILSSEVLFNENGYVIEDHQYNSEKELIRKIIYEYNSDHLLTKETFSESFSTGYFYDNRNNLIKEVTENFDSNSKMKTEYKYDVNNNLIEFLEFDNLDSLVFRTKLIYNTKNQLVEKTTIDESMGVMTNNTYKYDSIGNKIMSTAGLIHKYSYNKNKKIIKDETYLKDGSVDYIKVYEYDSNDNLIEEQNLDSKQKITYKSTYLYDSKGNLFQKADFNENQKELIREFNYEYFK
jgi:uncharacterized protein RhaS with RHS repeats